MECKYWLLVDDAEISRAFSYAMTPAAHREVRKLIFQKFDLLVDAWHAHFLT